MIFRLNVPTPATADNNDRPQEPRISEIFASQDDSYTRYTRRIPKLPLKKCLVWLGRPWEKKSLRCEDGDEGVFMQTKKWQDRFFGRTVADLDRMVHISDTLEILIYVAGAAPPAEKIIELPPPSFSLRPPASHGAPWTAQEISTPVEFISTSGSSHLQRAGCAFIYRPEDVKPRYNVRFSLEQCGPMLDAHFQTVDRATLRAIVAALEYRQIYPEGSTVKSITLATSNDYVYHGLTRYIETWRANGWKHFEEEIKHRRDFHEVTDEEDDDVADKDLWATVLVKSNGFARRKVKACFVLVEESINQEAAALAQVAARKGGLENYYSLAPYEPLEL